MLSIIQARMSSNRLPEKVLKFLEGNTILNRVIEQVKKSKSVNDIVVATSTEVSDNKIYKELRELWSESQISIVDNILNQMENDAANRIEWFQALDIILKSKEKNVYEIIKKNTTTLS